ncbi:MAG: hypothetical protein ACLQCB_08890 [Spirochaetia bacterium]
MKKGVILAVLVTVGMLAASTAAFARDFAIGAEAASVNFNGWGGRFVFHIPRVPLYFGVGGVIEQNGSAFDFTMDYWFTHGRLSGILDYYVGIGGYLALGTGNMSSFALGARLPIGLQIWPVGNVLELFLEVAPAWIPISGSGTSPLTFEVQPALGFRLWF